MPSWSRCSCLLAAALVSWGGDEKPAVDRVVVRKAQRELLLMDRDKVVRRYRVALGRNPVGPKTRQGDGKTPEGVYTISGRNPGSAFHKSLRVSYPSATDRAQAREADVDPGGDIMIHGLPNGRDWLGKAHVLMDWTEGCIAVTNEEVEEIWRLVADGTVVEITP